MDDRRLGMAVRARRHRRGWRLVDLAAAAGVGAGVCGLLERGEVERLSVRTARAVAAAVGLPLNWDVGWQRQEIDRLLDADHSTLAVHLTRRLEPHGWIVRSEVSFNHYGDRGRIDLLTYHPGARVLLVIEIKTAIVDGGELLGTLDVKTRVAPTLMRTLGWQPLHVIPAIILAGGTTVRRRVTDLDPLLRRFDLRAGRPGLGWRNRRRAPAASWPFSSCHRAIPLTVGAPGGGASGRRWAAHAQQQPFLTPQRLRNVANVNHVAGWERRPAQSRKSYISPSKGGCGWRSSRSRR
jgi:transcriptional regulator with XRE-family HTH domain